MSSNDSHRASTLAAGQYSVVRRIDFHLKRYECVGCSETGPLDELFEFWREPFGPLCFLCSEAVKLVERVRKEVNV